MDCRSGLGADWQASRLTGKDQPMILILAIAALIGAFRFGRRPAPASVDPARGKETVS